MNKTITIPTESIVTINKAGIVKVEHISQTKVEITRQVAEAILRLMGTTPEEALEAAASSIN